MKPVSKQRLLAIDFVRVYVVLMVVAVHVITQPPIFGAALPSALLTLLHVSREIFFILTGAVLTYTLRAGAVNWPKFWWRRYPAVVVPFVGWTLIYMVVGGNLGPFTTFLSNLAHNLRTGDASYQLYFLLVTMQLYAIFPIARWLLRVTRGRHLWLLGASFALQVMFSAAIHYGVTAPGIFAGWFAKPDPWLLSYQFYILAGCVAGYHMTALCDWVQRHTRLITAGVGATIVAGVGTYVWQLAEGTSAYQASAVFQPIVVVESVMFALGLLALGLRWEERGAAHKRLYLRLSDFSFGIYLCHLLIITWIYDALGAVGIHAFTNHLPVWVNLAVLLFVTTPLTYALSAGAIALARRTPLSLVLAGRPWARRVREESTPVLGVKAGV